MTGLPKVCCCSSLWTFAGFLKQMAFWLWFTSTWGWSCSAWDVVSPLEEGYTFFPVPSLPPGCICFFANCHSPTVFNSLSQQRQSAHSGTPRAYCSVHIALPDAYSDIFAKVQGRSAGRAFWDWTTLWAHGWMLSLRPGGSRVKCPHLFADSVTALPLKWNVFCINPNTVTLRSRALELFWEVVLIP